MLDKTKPEIINGVNVDDVKALAAGVEADPANGATTWRVKTTWRGRTHTQSKVGPITFAGEKIERDFTIDIDEPEVLAGADRHANPQEHLLAALNACMSVGYVALCALNGIRLDSLEIETTGDIDLRGFLDLDDAVAEGYEHLDYVVRIKGDATPEQFEEIHQQVMKTSPNFYNISRAIQLNAKLRVE